MENIINNLNCFLADLAVFYRKLQNYHWNIKGKDFFVIHSKLEEYYDKINEQIDEVGEYILTKNGEPLGTMKDYLAIAQIQEAENRKVDIVEVINSIKKDFEYLLNKANSLKKEAENAQDDETSTFMDEFISDYSKICWMLRQTME